MSDKNSPLITSLYSPKADEEFIIASDPADANFSQGIKVTITMKRNAVPILVDKVLPDEYKIQYFMKRDEQSTSSS